VITIQKKLTTHQKSPHTSILIVYFKSLNPGLIHSN